MKKSIALFFVLFLLLPVRASAQEASPSAQEESAAPPNPPPYLTATVAQQQCPGDAVVWLDMQTNLYYPADQRRSRYAATSSNGSYASGRYACLQQARQMGANPAGPFQ